MTLFDRTLVPSTRFSDHCANTVIQTSSAPLYKVQVAPTENSSPMTLKPRFSKTLEPENDVYVQVTPFQKSLCS